LALEQHILRIEEKLQQLLKKLQQVQSENVSLKEQLQFRDNELIMKQQQLEELENKLQLSRIAGHAQGAPATSEDDEEFKKEMRNKINEYIREIDRCIALLNI
jgi:chromosome segregation ATPase